MYSKPFYFFLFFRWCVSAQVDLTSIQRGLPSGFFYSAASHHPPLLPQMSPIFHLSTSTETCSYITQVPSAGHSPYAFCCYHTEKVFLLFLLSGSISLLHEPHCQFNGQDVTLRLHGRRPGPPWILWRSHSLVFSVISCTIVSSGQRHSTSFGCCGSLHGGPSRCCGPCCRPLFVFQSGEPLYPERPLYTRPPGSGVQQQQTTSRQTLTCIFLPVTQSCGSVLVSHKPSFSGLCLPPVPTASTAGGEEGGTSDFCRHQCRAKWWLRFGLSSSFWYLHPVISLFALWLHPPLPHPLVHHHSDWWDVLNALLLSSHCSVLSYLYFLHHVRGLFFPLRT